MFKKQIYLIFLFYILLENIAQAALTAKTLNTIQGTSPYITFNNGITKTTDVSAFLSIKLSDGTRYVIRENSAFPDAIVNKSTSSTPIELPVEGQKFKDIETFYPASFFVPNANGSYKPPDWGELVISHNYWRDDDGDGEGPNGVTAKGSFSMSINDATEGSKSYRLDDTLDPCYSPYNISLRLNNPILSTKYGDPNTIIPPEYNYLHAAYYIKPKFAKPLGCYALVNVVSYAGGSSFDNYRGFKLQNVDKPSSNFPRTGFNGAFFDLWVAGVTSAEVIAANESSPGSGEVNATSGAANIKLKLSVSSFKQPSGAQTARNSVVRVTLSGPSSGQKDRNQPPAAVNMPTEFNLYSDAAKTNKIYSFSLSKWFIPNSGSGVTYDAARAYCASLPGSYRVPSLGEFRFDDDIKYIIKHGYNRNDYYLDTYRREIGNGKQQGEVGIDDGVGGLLSEWEPTGKYYPGSDFVNSKYRTSDYVGYNYLVVDLSNISGEQIYNGSWGSSYQPVCVTP